MPISFAYTKTETLEVWNGVFYSPDHDPELNRDPDFLDWVGHVATWISLDNAEEDNSLLSIAGTLKYADPELGSVDIDNFQSSGTGYLIRSNKDSVQLHFSCKDITPNNFDSFNWKKSEDESTMEHAFTHKIRANWREQNSDSLTISGTITNRLPTCRQKVLFNGDEMDIGGQVDIDLESESFAIRLVEINDDEDSHYLEGYIFDGHVLNLDVLRKLVMFRQTYGGNQPIDSLDIKGFSLEARISGTGESFILDLIYTLNSGPDVEVPPAVNKIGLMLIDPMDLERPAGTDIDADGKGLYNFIPGIVTVMADASPAIVNLTPVGDCIEINGVEYPGFNATLVIPEKQPNDDDKPIDIPMTISLPNGATEIHITPIIKPSEEPHPWNEWSDPQDVFGIVNNKGTIDIFKENYQIVDNNEMYSIDIVFRIHQKDYWNGDFNLHLQIDSYKKETQEGQTLYKLPVPISIKPIVNDNIVLIKRII